MPDQTLEPNVAAQLREAARSLLAADPQSSLKISQKLLTAGYRDPDALDLVSSALIGLAQYARAVPLLEELRQRVGDDPRILESLVDTYGATANYTGLSALVEPVLALGSFKAALLLQLRLLNNLSDHERAVERARLLVETEPNDPECWSMLAWHEQGCGSLDDAATHYRRALELQPGHTRAHYALAYLHKATPENNCIEQLDSCLENTPETQSFDRSALHSALGKQHEDLEQYQQAFEHFQASAEITGGNASYSPDAQRQVYRAAAGWIRRQQAREDLAGYEEIAPIFIVGLPRTGSTLLDRMLSSHEQVRSGGELLCFRAALREVGGDTGRSDFFERLFGDPERKVDFSAIGKRYAELSAGAVGGAEVFTDKLPMNVFLLGVIAMALPRARFLHTIRNPADSCFSVYKQLFAPDYYRYSYSLENCAHHLALQLDLMNQWHSLFPGRILDVRYETLVESPREVMEAVLAHCTLPWDEQCLSFQENRAPVDTASAAQVRRPLYKTAISRWRHYEPWLGSLLQTLQELGLDPES